MSLANVAMTVAWLSALRDHVRAVEDRLAVLQTQASRRAPGIPGAQAKVSASTFHASSKLEVKRPLPNMATGGHVGAQVTVIRATRVESMST